MPTEEIQRVRLELRGNLRKFFTMKDPEIILSGPAGTGKTRIVLEQRHLITQKYPMSRGLLVRKYRSSMNETVLHCLNNEVFRDEHGYTYSDAPTWRERDQKYVYGNGSEIVVAGMDDPSKVLSSMYDWFYWNEAIEAKRAEWEMVMSRLRNFRVPYQQAIGDTNPGPPSHWIKQFALDGRIKLLETSHKDNPTYYDDKLKKWTKRGEQYVQNILGKGLTGLRRARLYLGQWVMAEGQVYEEFNPEYHVCPRFTPPPHWPRYWVFDFGFIDPFVWLELVEDPDTGILYVYRELYHTRLRVEEACGIIREATWGQPGPVALICDHDAENRATLEKEFSMLTLAAYKPIHPGINGLKNRLKLEPKLSNPTYPDGRALVMLMENTNIRPDKELRDRHKPTCTIEEFDSYVWDTGKISLDKYKDMPVDRDNHGMDALRYGVAFVDNIAIDPQQVETVINFNDQFDEDDELEHQLNTMISLY